MEQGSLHKQLSFIAEGPPKLGAKWRKLACIFLCISISLVIQWYHFRWIEDERANLPLPYFLSSWGCLRHRPSPPPDAWILLGTLESQAGFLCWGRLRSASAQCWGENGQMCAALTPAVSGCFFERKLYRLLATRRDVLLVCYLMVPGCPCILEPC